MKESSSHTREFFASANGYTGFRSYFDEIFDSRDYTAIYVLKGGPGTGKSTLLKKLCEYSCEARLNFEIFRCSSDPNSLDAVIIEGGGKRIAVLDGTAPHMRDAELPGAVDELINLGEAWDDKKLKEYRSVIIDLNQRKSGHYAKAYDRLRKSSIFDTNIKAETEKIFNFKKCRTVCETILDGFHELKKGNRTPRLISSFSKYGYRKQNLHFGNQARNYYVSGKFESEFFFMNVLLDVIKERGLECVLIPSALDARSYEGLIFPSSDISIFTRDGNLLLYDSASLLNLERLNESDDALQQLYIGRDYYQKLAADELKKASDFHFELEKIYSPCMNFDILDRIYEDLLSKIKNILQT